MRKTTINISSLNQDVKNQNEDFLRSMDGIIAVLDSIRQIGKNGSSYGLQNDLIELTNDLPHKLLAALDGNDVWPEWVKQAFLREVKKGLPAETLKKLDGSDYTYSSTGTTDAQLAELQQALTDHITFSLNATANKHAELAAKATLVEYDKIAGIVEQSGLKDAVQPEVAATTQMLTALAQHHAEFGVVGASIQGTPQQQQAAMQAGTQIVAKLEQEKIQLRDKLAQTNQKVAVSTKAIDADIVQKEQEIKQPKAELTIAKQELTAANNKLKEVRIKLKQAELTAEDLPDGPAKQIENTHVTTLKDQETLAIAEVKKVNDKIDKTEAQIANLISETELLKKQKEILDQTAKDVRTQEQTLGTISFVQANNPGTVVANQQSITAIAEIVTAAHKSAVEHAIFSNKDLVPKLVQNGIDVFTVSRLFSVPEPGARTAVVKNFTDTIDLIAGHNNTIRPTDSTDKAREDAVIEAVATAGKALQNTLDILVAGNKLDAVTAAQAEAIATAEHAIQDAINSGISEQQALLQQQIINKVKAYTSELSQVTDAAAVPGVVAKHKQAIHDLVVGANGNPGATDDTLKKVATALHTDPSVLQFMQFLDLGGKLGDLQTNVNDTSFNSFVGDVDSRLIDTLKIAARQAADVVAAIKKADELQQEAQGATNTATVDPALQKLSNHLPHTMKKILQWSEQYPKASAGSQSFF